jgi:hypothetical protein
MPGAVVPAPRRGAVQREVETCQALPFRRSRATNAEYLDLWAFDAHATSRNAVEADTR